MPTCTISPETAINFSFSGSGTGPTLVFLHYWGGSSRTFAPLVSLLSPRFSTLSIDFRGWGESTGPKSPNAYSILDLAQDVESLIEKLAVKDFVLVGHSMGGKVAQLIGGRGKVAGLKAIVLIGPAPPTPLVLPEEMKTTQITAYDTAESAEFVVRNVLTSSAVADDVVKTLVQDITKGSEFARLAWPTYAILENIIEEMKQISVPVLVIGGGKDNIETLERLQSEVVSNIRNAEIVVVEGSGHLLPIEAPNEVAKYIGGFVERELELGIRAKLMAQDLIDKDLQDLRRSVYSQRGRKRGYHACIPCRLRKLKCVPREAGSGPQCIRCHKEKKECEWTVARNKKKCNEIRNQEAVLEERRNISQEEDPLLQQISADEGNALHESSISNEAVTSITHRQVAYRRIENAGTHLQPPLSRVDIREVQSLDIIEPSLTGTTPIHPEDSLFHQDEPNLDNILALRFAIEDDNYKEDSFLSSSGYTKYFDSPVKMLEARTKILRDNTSDELPLHENITNLYLWSGIESLIKDVKKVLFASKEHTARVVKDKCYVWKIQKFEPRLRGWNRDFEKLKVPLQASLILRIEYEYAQVLLNSIVLEVMTETFNVTSLISKYDDKYIETLINSCQSIIKIVHRSFRELLTSSPMRTYLRTLTAASVLLKLSELNINRQQVSANLRFIRQALPILRVCENDYLPNLSSNLTFSCNDDNVHSYQA
ncbi:hypothetical protein B7463_g4864, partial [Scytalidium lignicola]